MGKFDKKLAGEKEGERKLPGALPLRGSAREPESST
jgi:hypothetical protein